MTSLRPKPNQYGSYKPISTTRLINPAGTTVLSTAGIRVYHGTVGFLSLSVCARNALRASKIRYNAMTGAAENFTRVANEKDSMGARYSFHVGCVSAPLRSAWTL